MPPSRGFGNKRSLRYLSVFFLLLGAFAAPKSFVSAPLPAAEAGFSPDMDKQARVIFYAKNEAEINAEVAGKVQKVHLLAGASFAKGQLLLELDKSVCRPALEQAQAALRLAQANRKRVEALIAGGLQTAQAEAALRAARENAAYLAAIQKDQTKLRKAEAIRDAAQKNLDSFRQMQQSNEATVAQLANANRDLIAAESDRRMIAAGEGAEMALALKEVATAELNLQTVRTAQATDLAQAENDLARAKTACAVAERDLRACDLLAPYDGRLAAVRVHDHEIVAAGQPLVRIIEDTTLYAKFLLPAEALAKIRPGAELGIFVPVLGRAVPARVVRFSAEIDPASNTLEVTAEADNRDMALRAGLTGWIPRDTLPAGGP